MERVYFSYLVNGRVFASVILANDFFACDLFTYHYKNLYFKIRFIRNFRVSCVLFAQNTKVSELCTQFVTNETLLQCAHRCDTVSRERETGRNSILKYVYSMNWNTCYSTQSSWILIWSQLNVHTTHTRSGRLWNEKSTNFKNEQIQEKCPLLCAMLLLE